MNCVTLEVIGTKISPQHVKFIGSFIKMMVPLMPVKQTKTPAAKSKENGKFA